jgi:hypothetical protein
MPVALRSRVKKQKTCTQESCACLLHCDSFSAYFRSCDLSVEVALLITVQPFYIAVSTCTAPKRKHTVLLISDRVSTATVSYSSSSRCRRLNLAPFAAEPFLFLKATAVPALEAASSAAAAAAAAAVSIERAVAVTVTAV